MGEWQPIESAPKDGNSILLAWRDEDGGVREVDKAYWGHDDEHDGLWFIDCMCEGIARWQHGYTHWMPLPPPPTQEGKA